MKVKPVDPPRVFETGRGEVIRIRDCARIELEPDEQVTFTTPGGAEYDVARKAWGFYATPSLNARLLDFGLRAALVRGAVGKYYLLLVERGREDALARYLESEENTLVRWLDNPADLAAVESGPIAPAAAGWPALHCPCGEDRFRTVHMYRAAPEGETRLPMSGGGYRREVFRCTLCGHYVSVHGMDDGGLYSGAYVDATYGDDAGLARAFTRIRTLPEERSDNAGRVRRVTEVALHHLGAPPAPPRPFTVLDVGSGLCVFLDRMRQYGFACTALDPDSRAVRHARETVGVAAVRGEIGKAEGLGRYDLVTLNKVLEHVRDPIAALSWAADLVSDRGLLYVELPDGEAAAAAGFGREEFFIEHHHVFSLASAGLLAVRAGLRVLSLERLREPSGKYTLRAFLLRPAGAGSP